MHTMQSDYKKEFSCESTPDIIQLIESSRGSYSIESLVDDILKLNALVKRSGLENIIYLLIELKIIEVKKTKLYLKETVSIKKIKQLIQSKLIDDGVMDLLIAYSTESNNIRLVNTKQLYFANHAGVIGILIYLGLVENSSEGFKLNYQKDLIKKFFKKTPEQLKIEQQAQEERGEAAEVYVLDKELERFKDHPKIELIKRVSLESVSEGYDIQSFLSEESEVIDKFIEVKSHFNSNRIFWSINEIRKAEEKQKNYYLYIVDSTQLGKEDYEYLAIENPFEYFQIRKYIIEEKTEKIRIQPQNFSITLA